ncbi:MAG TPA: hypothetical protein PK926_07790 [Spirochaetota bacterium]|nr:hypothetical protein [Spirochaetota bacterium]HPI90290.1 hypothetical protein [Spirochaetota bacterium]HPR46372.1 hypothetical protein [Spirochaetota bacterium]
MRAAGNIMRLCLLLLLVLFVGPVSADPAEPAAPASPDVSSGAGVELSYAAELHLAGGEKQAGEILVPLDSITFKTINSGDVRTVKIDDIAEIVFLRWKGSRKNGEAWIFSPSLVSIILKNGTEYRCGYLSEFARFRFKSSGGRGFRYSYFYDYCTGGVWRHAGTAQDSYPENAPVTGTVIRIVFRSSRNENNIRDILNFFRGTR